MPPAPRPGPCDASPTGLSASQPKSVTSKRGSPTPSIPARPGSPNATASAPTAPPPCSSPPATTPNGSTAKHPSPRCAAPARSRPPPPRPNAAAATEAATGKPTPPCIASPCPASAGTPPPAATSTDASPKAPPPRSDPLPQALHRPRDLPDHHPVPTNPNHGPLSRLTSIGASSRNAVPAHRQHDHIGWEAEPGEGRLCRGTRARATDPHTNSLAAEARSQRTQQTEPWLPAAGVAWRCARSAGLAEGEGVGSDLGGADRPDVAGSGAHAVEQVVVAAHIGHHRPGAAV